MIIKKWFTSFIVLILTASLVVHAGCTSKEQKQATFLGTVQELMQTLGLPACADLKECVNVTQKEWLRTPGKERWQIGDTKEEQRVLVMPYVEKLGMVATCEPQKNTYDYALLLGATVAAMRERLHFLCTLWQKGVRFEKVFFLVGQRSLDQQEEIDMLAAEGVSPLDMPATETEAIRSIISTTTLPEGLQAVLFIIVDSPCTIAPNGAVCRPTTADTVHAFLKENKQPGSVLAISNQPFCVYQHVVLRTLLPQEYALETVGYKASATTTVAVYLDSIARILYQAYTSGHTDIEALV